MRHHYGLAGAVFALFATGAAQAANLIHDGGFELPVVTNGNGDFYATGTKLSQWTVVGATGNVEVVDGSLVYGGFTFNARGGKQWLDLTGNTQTATGVSQHFTTTPGTSYTLKFSVGSVYDTSGQYGTNSTISVFNGTTLLTTVVGNGVAGTTNMHWTTFTVPFTASATKTTLSFINGDPPTDSICGLDDVSVVPAAAKPAILDGLRAH